MKTLKVSKIALTITEGLYNLSDINRLTKLLNLWENYIFLINFKLYSMLQMIWKRKALQNKQEKHWKEENRCVGRHASSSVDKQVFTQIFKVEEKGIRLCVSREERW